MESTEALTALRTLTDEFGMGVNDIADATGARVPRLRAARREDDDLAADVAGRLVDLLRVLVAAVDVTGADPCAISTRFVARLEDMLAPRVLDVFAAGRDDLVAAALVGDLGGVQVLDAWRPKWRSELDVSRFSVVVAGDGYPSLVLRSEEEVRADQEHLGIVTPA